MKKSFLSRRQLPVIPPLLLLLRFLCTPPLHSLPFPSSSFLHIRIKNPLLSSPPRPPPPLSLSRIPPFSSFFCCTFLPPPILFPFLGCSATEQTGPCFEYRASLLCARFSYSFFPRVCHLWGKTFTFLPNKKRKGLFPFLFSVAFSWRSRLGASLLLFNPRQALFFPCYPAPPFPHRDTKARGAGRERGRTNPQKNQSYTRIEKSC